MRVHEAVIVVAMLFAGSRLAGGMARRDAPLKVSDVSTAATRQNGPAANVAGVDTNPCARTVEYQFRCDPARPRALDGRGMPADPPAGVANGFRRR